MSCLEWSHYSTVLLGRIQLVALDHIRKSQFSYFQITKFNCDFNGGLSSLNIMASYFCAAVYFVKTAASVIGKGLFQIRA